MSSAVLNIVYCLVVLYLSTFRWLPIIFAAASRPVCLMWQDPPEMTDVRAVVRTANDIANTTTVPDVCYAQA